MTIDYNTDLPLHQPWQRAATRELTELLHLVCCGEFDDVQQLSDRLFLSAEGLRQMYASPNLKPGIERELTDDVFSRFHRQLRPSGAPQLPVLPSDPNPSIADEWDVTA